MVVSRSPVRVAATSTEPCAPRRMFLPLTEVWSGGSCGTTDSVPVPSEGATPSHWCTTGHSVP